MYFYNLNSTHILLSPNKMNTDPYTNSCQSNQHNQGIAMKVMGKEELGRQVRMVAREMEDLVHAHWNKNIGMTKRTLSARGVSTSASPHH
jgi:hypothetical protein